jgi:saccharopine dehydrogenase-like NADP-dependent oxidoreductase
MGICEADVMMPVVPMFHANAWGMPFTATMVGAKMVLQKKWSGKGVMNVEQFDPDPFMEEVAKQGLPWHIKELKVIAKTGPLAA